MKKGLLFIYIFSFMALVIHSQEPAYRLDKVVITAHDYESKAPVLKKSLNDSLEIVSTVWDFPTIPVFKSVTLTDDKISLVELIEDGNLYRLNPEDNTLRLSDIQHPKEKSEELVAEKVFETANGFEFPPYTIQQSGNRLTIIFDHIIYGSSNYPTQTLDGKCEMIYVRP